MAGRSSPYRLGALAMLLLAAGAARAAPPAEPPVARVVLQYGHASAISAADWTPDGRFLVTGSTDGQLLLWDLAGNIVGQAALGSPDERTVVERIAVAADGRSVAIDELFFEDMWDNGVASELHRRSYVYRFGDAAATATGQVDVDPLWKPGTPFLAGTRAMKAALMARTAWPKSRLGWTLVRQGDVLAMRSPAATIKLTGALGAASDQGDRRLEGRALEFERRWAAIRAQIDPSSTREAPVPAIDRSSPPAFSPDGALLAWIERDAAADRVHRLDLKGGAALPVVTLPAGPRARAIAWAGPTTIVIGRDTAAPLAIDAKSGTITAARTPVSADPNAIVACAAGAARAPLCLNAAGQVEVADAVTGAALCIAEIDEGDPIPATRAVASADGRTIALQSASGYTALFRIPSAAVGGARRCPEGPALRAQPGRVGFHPTAPLLWSEGRGGALTFTAIARPNGAPETALATLYRLPGDRFFVRDAVGRYDSDLGPDADAVRWQVSDAPFRSFPAQTFMRDYFEPRLFARLIDCTIADTCAAAFPAIPPIAALNRVLPTVEIIGVTAGSDPASAIVKVRVTDGVDPSATNVKTRSGAYDVRLFLNNRMVAQRPDAAAPGDIAAWRARYRLSEASAPGGTELSFTVALPTAAGTETSAFSAYAFNEDRVKSATARAIYRRPIVAAAPRRAFVVTIGIDAYDDPRLRLNFSANDATLIADRLANIPGYAVRRLTLTGTIAPDGTTRRVTRADIVALLGGLSGAGPDAARPDDIVIISFSGHGWADASGNFYLFPADTAWPAGAAAPDRATLLSSGDLAQLLLPVRAAEITVVIDACHSAASVATSGFKPGPMGDAGLGQLAFDKGIRILAASQADDVALESSALRQGLLTYALAAEGIDATGGRADLDRDGAITISEWLRYGADRLPQLSDDVRVGNAISAARGFRVVLPPGERAATQQPALFDFTARPSPVVLRKVALR